MTFLWLNIIALSITIFGFLGVFLLYYDLRNLKKVLSFFKYFKRDAENNYQDLVEVIRELTILARKEGTLALEKYQYYFEDNIYRKGIRMLVDGINEELIKNILGTELERNLAKGKQKQDLIKSCANLTLVSGFITSLLSLIYAFWQMQTLSTLIWSFSLTLAIIVYNFGLCFLVFYPLATKINLKVSEDQIYKMAMIEGIVGIQMGLNYRILQEKLNSYLPEELVVGNDES